MSESRTQRIARNTFFLYIRMFLMMAVNLYTSRVILRVLGFEDFGLYNVVGSVVVFAAFLQAALRNSTIRYITYDLGVGILRNLRVTYSMAIYCHLILGVSLFLLMELGGVWFLNSQLVISEERIIAANWCFQYSLLAFCITIFRTPYEANIIAHEKMDFYALTSIVEAVLKLTTVFLLMIFPFDKLVTYSLLLLLVTVVLCLWYYLYCKTKFVDCVFVRCWDSKILRQFTSYSGWALVVNGATMTRTECINIFFNLFLGVLSNAALGIANQAVGALNGFVVNFTQAFKPQIIKSWAEKDYEYFMKIVLSTSKLSYFLLLVVTIPVVVNVDYILKIWLVDYPPMTSAFIYTVILYYLVDAIQMPLVIAVHATGKLKIHQIMIGTLVILVIPISYVMLKYGYSGTTVLTMNALANLICATVRTIYMQRLINLNLNQYLKNVLFPSFFVTIFAVPIPFWLTYITESSFVIFLTTSIFSVALTVALCYTVGLDKSEKDFLLSIPMMKKINKFING